MKQYAKKNVHKNQKNFQKGIKAKRGINDYQFYIAAVFIINFIKRIFDRGKT